jgi:ribosomal protein L14
LPASTASLQGSAADADGTITSYQWVQVAGPSAATLTTPRGANTTAANLQQGIYQFELSATDNIGATSRDTVIITVLAPVIVNAPPVSNAGADQTISLPATTATLQGSGSDYDGQITGYQWTMISGPSTAAIATPVAAVTQVSGLVQGVYTFQLLVTDNSGATARDTVRIVVVPAGNTAPVANAGADQMITLPVNSVTLAGSGSDADGSIAAFQWTKIAGPSSFTITSSSAAQTMVTNLILGTYTFELTVSDNYGATGRDTVIVVVQSGNTPPVADAGRDHDIRLPTSSVMLQGSGRDTDGTVVSYQWTAASGPGAFTFVNPSQANTQVRDLVQGTYEFVLRVTDNSGASVTDTVQVLVRPSNRKPTTSTVNRVSVQLPVAMAVLEGSATDDDGYITSYRWRKVSGPASGRIVNNGHRQTTVTQLSEGLYGFEFTAIDNEGEEGKDTVWMTVLPINQIPVVSAGPDKVIQLPASTVQLNGGARDNDGTITSLQWNQVSGPACRIATPNAPAATVSELAEGTYRFELVATDNKGGQGRDTVEVRVEDPTVGLGNGTVFPNPAASSLHVLIRAETQRNVTTIHVVDMSGRVVMTDHFMRNTHRVLRTLDVSVLKPGVYMVYIDWEINKKLATKFIKQ